VTRAIHRSADLRSAGLTDDEVRRKVRSGVLARVRRGAYADGVLPDEAVARHRLLVRAAVGELDEAAAVSHVSAAALHGLDL
jgi:predicted transcriptional regulator of viral defense system